MELDQLDALLVAGLLRSRLSVNGNNARPSSHPSMSPSVPSDSDVKKPAGAEAVANQDESRQPPVTCEREMAEVRTQSQDPISADFSTSGSSSAAALQVRDPAGSTSDSRAETLSVSVRESASTSAMPESYVVVHNVAKRHNLGTLARSASAFGVTELILVGRKDFNAFGSHGASLHIQFRHFYTLAEAALYLKAKDVDICGVEIMEGAVPVHKHPFTRSTAFVLGNEGTGLSEKEMSICSFFVYIPQCGDGTASLNVTVAASIVLHHFSVWAGFAEREREGQKFVVAEKPVRRTHRNVVEDPDALKERRRLKADSISDAWLFCDGEDGSEFNEDTDGTDLE